MDANALLDLVHEAPSQLWIDKINQTHQAGHLCKWISTFHPTHLPCHLDGTFHHGAFNAGIKMVFTDSTAWMVRFPRVGMVSDDHADEKVAMEVAALNLIGDRTSIPVPKVRAWGLAASNSLGLGPFIMMDFIEGVSLSDILRDPNADRPTRLMREDISDSDIEFVYRQMASFLLQLFELDFDRIGSLPWPGDESDTPLRRPLSFKVHSILQNGGVDTFGDRHQGFATTTEYFHYTIKQDWQQLLHQPNSVFGYYDAQNKYIAFKTLQGLIPDLINQKYDHHKFKLICDDLGLANLIVRSREDLTVVGVVDLEWSYIGPAPLFGSAPWWLLQDRPVNSAWDCTADGEQPKIAEWYFKYLDIFIRVLEEEEALMHGNDDKELSSLVKWSRESGAMWLHMLISSGFNDQRSFPFVQLKRHLGEDRWAEYEKRCSISAEDLDAFATRKVEQLDDYDEALVKMEEEKALVDSGRMTREALIAHALSLLGERVEHISTYLY